MIDCFITILLNLPAPFDITVYQFRSDVAHIYLIHLIRSSFCSTEKCSKYIHTAFPVHVSASANPIPGVIRIQASYRKFHEIFSLILASKGLIRKKTIDYLNCYLIRMLLVVLSQLRINPVEYSLSDKQTQF